MTAASRLSVFGGGQLIWKVGVVVVFSYFLFTTTTASRLSQGLGRCFRGCVVVAVLQLMDDNKLRVGRGVEAFGLALDLFVEVGAIVWATIFRCAFWWCCCVWFDA